MLKTVQIVVVEDGNTDEMLEKNKKGELQVRTAHSLNAVPFIIYDKKNSFTIKEGDFWSCKRCSYCSFYP